MARYFRVALPLHVADEELSIRPRLLAAPAAPAVRLALDAMTQEHAAIDALVTALLPRWAALAAGPGELASLAPALAEDCADLRRRFDAHLEQEERTLFPAVREHLGAASLAIRAEMAARRGVVGLEPAPSPSGRRFSSQRPDVEPWSPQPSPRPSMTVATSRAVPQRVALTRESRREHRYPVTMAATWLHREGPRRLLVRDVSFNGFAVESEHPLTLRHLIRCRLELPGSPKPFVFHAMIMHRRDPLGAGRSAPPLFGLLLARPRGPRHGPAWSTTCGPIPASSTSTSAPPERAPRRSTRAYTARS